MESLFFIIKRLSLATVKWVTHRRLMGNVASINVREGKATKKSTPYKIDFVLNLQQLQPNPILD